MNLLQRIERHARLSGRALFPRARQTPPFLIVFVNSLCNLTCEHCFYWRNLNRRDDLTFEEFRRLSNELGTIENLNVSGGEPFLREDFAEIVSLFVENNRAREVYIPTNGYFTDKTERHVRRMLESPTLKLLACELSLDGMPDYHNRFRGNPQSFEKAMETHDRLAGIQRDDPRLRIHAISTATSENIGELAALTRLLYERCPAMDHHNLAMIRGDRKNEALLAPPLDQYAALAADVATVWADREKGRRGAIVEPLLQWAKRKIVETDSQFVPCTAGRMTGVIYANGDVSVCENHPPLGNLRERSFFEIWESEEAESLRGNIRAKACHCTNEVFLWPSIVFQPGQLTRALVGSGAWRGAGGGGESGAESAERGTEVAGR